MNTFTNKLIDELSPYLKQHAHNPIHWETWSEEVFDRAKRENKLVFLSIGYSTCHWCHTMARECFEDETVAEILNQNFISVKVDREQRPDIDFVYMTYARHMIGRGGWPLNLILLPDGKPFFAATYIPKFTKGNLVGFIEILNQAQSLYAKQREKLVLYCEQIHETVEKENHVAIDYHADRNVLIRECADQLIESYDREYGGFSKAPKFPMAHYIMAALYLSESFDVPQLRRAGEYTLMMLRQGGIYDQLGYGFMRYSTDQAWIVPHFEKMLYDNAVLAFTYTEAYRLTGRIGYADTAHEIVQYLNEKLLSEKGSYYSAQDAITEHGEGAYYLWTPEEIEQAVGKGLAGAISNMIGVCEAPNFEGKWIPNQIKCKGKMDQQHWEDAHKKLKAFRDKRPQPKIDKKILTGWNGLMVASLARMGAILKEDIYIKRAMHVLEAIGGNGNPEELLSGTMEGASLGPAFFEDYAYLIWGLVELFKATKMPEFALQAKTLARYCEREFHQKDGGYTMTGTRHEKLLIEPIQLFDQALPSSNGIHLWNLFRLSALGADEMLKNAAEAHEIFMLKQATQYPLENISSIIALLRSGRIN